MHPLTISDQFFPVAQFPSGMVYGSISYSSCAITACLLQLPLQALLSVTALFCLEKWHHCSDRLIFLVTSLLTRSFMWTRIVVLWCRVCLLHCMLDTWQLWLVRCTLFCVRHFVLCVCASGAEQPVMLELPNQWLWDIIDEFIYQV